MAESKPSPLGGAMSGLLAAAVTHHEMVTSYTQAGFSREEAIAITSDLLKASRMNELWIANENKRRDEGKQ